MQKHKLASINMFFMMVKIVIIEPLGDDGVFKEAYKR